MPLPSGGNLVIDHAEALTVIDVNTGRFAGGKGLEETITHTNLEAAREVVRQLRLRDIGGIIIIDFIDMARAKNREMVLATLEAELETDRTKTYVVELSPLGLVEMTRQNTTDGARGILTRTLPGLLGQGARAERRDDGAQRRAPRAYAGAALASQGLARRGQCGGRRPSHAATASSASRRRSAAACSSRADRPCRSTLSESSAEGSAAHVQEQRIPVREGQEVEVELEFSLTYSPRDAVGYIDGYMVIVEGGRQYLGQRRKVQASRLRHGRAPPPSPLRDQSN